MKRIGVLTSGGDAPGMNAAIRAVVRAASARDMSVIGFKRGYNGPLMQSKNHTDDFEILTNRSVSGRVHRGGTFLMTARCLEFHNREVQEKAIQNMRALGLEGLVCIGGDGTFNGANALNSLGFPTVGIPGTIDNDLAYTDFTIGFDTAVNTAIDSVNRIRETSESHERASLITVMGRNCGDLAVHTALACGAEFALIPEKEWWIEDIADQIRWGALSGKRSNIIIFAEGAFDSLKSNLHDLCHKHEKLKGIENDQITSSKLAHIFEVLSGYEVRATVLGYIQRGGNPSAYDRNLASRMGAHAVKLLHEGRSGCAVGLRGNQMVDVPFNEIIGTRRGINQELADLVDMLS